MAGYNEILTGRFNRGLQKFFSMKGPASVNELTSTIQSQIGLFWGPECRYLEGWGRFSGALSQAAVAAAVSGIRIRNGTQNSVAIFEKLAIAANVTDPFCTLNIGPTTVDLATIVPSITLGRLDPRGQLQPSMIVSKTTTPGILSFVIGGSPLIANNPVVDLIIDSDSQITLLPGDAIQVTTQGLNSQLQLVATWRERTLEDSELK
jgi:hypothetical protein